MAPALSIVTTASSAMSTIRRMRSSLARSPSSARLRSADVGRDAEHALHLPFAIAKRTLHRDIGAVSVARRHQLLFDQRRLGVDHPPIDRPKDGGRLRRKQLMVVLSDDGLTAKTEHLHETPVHHHVAALHVLHG